MAETRHPMMRSRGRIQTVLMRIRLCPHLHQYRQVSLWAMMRGKRWIPLVRHLTLLASDLLVF
jgi:hypothetical protein